MVQSILVFFFLLSFAVTTAQTTKKNNTGTKTFSFYRADHPFFQYTGRIDFTNPLLPRFWAPGVYIQVRFKGPYCEIQINDEELWGRSHNYIEIVIDNKKPLRIQTTAKQNSIVIARDLSKGEHTITICKNTESNIGFLEFAGMKCEALLAPQTEPVRKIEFIGNSITCGTGIDQSIIPCHKGEWHDQHNAYLSYGPTTARALKARWQLTAVSGIGLIHSCCNMTMTMPEVFDKVDLRTNSIPWNFKNYQPDVLTICLGQNDGIQDSAKFSSAYIKFIGQLRKYYPGTNIICLNSPMADAALTIVLKKYISGVVQYVNRRGDKKVHSYFFSKRYYRGCDTHPDLSEHEQIASELTAFIKKLRKW